MMRLSEAPARSELHVYTPLSSSDHDSKVRVRLKGLVVFWLGLSDETSETFFPVGEAHERFPDPWQSMVKGMLSLLTK